MAGEHKVHPYSLLTFDCDLVLKEGTAPWP
jgi:hypothetical protein